MARSPSQSVLCLLLVSCSSVVLCSSSRLTNLFVEYKKPNLTSILRTYGQYSREILDAQIHRRALTEEEEDVKPEFEPCEMSLSDITPCFEQSTAMKFPRENVEHRERHCPAPEEIPICLVPPPAGYRTPVPWPQSREEAWYVNVPYKHLTTEKSVQNWIQYDEVTEKFNFPGGGTMFPKGADAYIQELGELIPLNDGTIRTALDTGCGVASFGAYMLNHNILTVSIAPKDNHEAQVQFALERGVPGMIGVMGTKRLPFPARSFDLAHCSRCLIPWGKRGGLYLVELDRVLRPGGYWILSGPPVNWRKHHSGWNRTREDLSAEQEEIEMIARNLCWKKVAEKGMFAVWQKPLNHNCATANRRELTGSNTEDSPSSDILRPGPIPLCTIGSDPDTAWYEPLKLCISRMPSAGGSGAAGGLHPISGSKSVEEVQVPVQWPDRIAAVPPRVKLGFVPNMNEEKFLSSIPRWTVRLASYKSVLPPLAQAKYRNILDTNAEAGGFAAALNKDPAWVMNVVPISNPIDTLGLIYERGLIGTYHDWCEAFSSYPRTYDFIHVHLLFSVLEGKCPEEVVMLELDRLLRPEGAAIFYDTEATLQVIAGIAKRMRWDARLEGTQGSKFLVCVKKYWTAA